MMSEGLFGVILLSIAGGAFVYCLIELNSCKDICNKLMRNIKTYIKKSEQLELPLKMKKQPPKYLSGKTKKKKSAKKTKK
tara:strand:- start:6 stop:245 length:240 start_codon:yes stop_codon:yes gene_type:complete